jgi:hypothetical protein
MISKVPEAFVFMKVGDHAREDFNSILDRKHQEFERTGRIFWGYGGMACHPLTQVQPFVRMQAQKYGAVYLLMEKIDSNADPDIVPATMYSEDGVNWMKIPDGIEVIGSRYALVLDEIKPGDLELSVVNYEVGIGPSRGKNASEYIEGRIDKACLVSTSKETKSVEPKIKRITICARLLEPYAVLLK